MYFPTTEEQRLQTIALQQQGNPHDGLASLLGASSSAINRQIDTKDRAPSLSALSKRTRSQVRASQTATPTITSETKYTIAEFKPAPGSPIVNATMTEPYLGLGDIPYRR